MRKVFGKAIFVPDIATGASLARCLKTTGITVGGDRKGALNGTAKSSLSLHRAFVKSDPTMRTTRTSSPK